MRLAGFELRKLLCQKSLVVIFVICAMVNLLLLSFQGAGSYTPGMYLALMEDLSGMTAEDARDRVYEKREVLQEYIFRAEAEYDGEAAEEMVPYTGDVWMERDLLDDVLIEIHQAIEMCNIYSNILSGTMDAFASVISNNLNIVMKVLTVITIVMAIPNIIFGFYGMNVGGLPVAQSWIPPLIIAIIAMGIATWIFMKKDMFH